jgi:hypothetical protein
MSIDRIFYCNGPDCDRHVKTARPRPEMFLTISKRGGPAFTSAAGTAFHDTRPARRPNS